MAGVSHALAPDPWPVAAWCAGRGPWPACLVACYLVRALVRLVPGARPPILATWWPIRGPRRVRPGGRRPWRVRLVACAWCLAAGARSGSPGRRRAAPGPVPRAQKTAPVAVDEGLGPVLRSQWWSEQFSCSPETGPLCKKLDFGLQFFVEQIQFVP